MREKPLISFWPLLISVESGFVAAIVFLTGGFQILILLIMSVAVLVTLLVNPNPFDNFTATLETFLSTVLIGICVGLLLLIVQGTFYAWLLDRSGKPSSKSNMIIGGALSPLIRVCIEIAALGIFTLIGEITQGTYNPQTVPQTIVNPFTTFLFLYCVLSAPLGAAGAALYLRIRHRREAQTPAAA